MQGNRLVCACCFDFGTKTGKKVIIDAITTRGQKKRLWKTKFDTWLHGAVSKVMESLRNAAKSKGLQPERINGLTIAIDASYVAARTVSSSFLYGLGEDDNG